MARRGRHLKGEAGLTNHERLAKQMQSEESRAGARFRDRGLGVLAVPFLSIYLPKQWVGRDERQLNALQNQMDKLEITLSGSHRVR